MSKYRTEGRMIKKDISNSQKFAQLSPHAAVLFAMLIPHYNSHGKMNGGPGFVKDEVCPLVPYLTYKNIPELLKEISLKTSVKWFEHSGRYWIHSLHFLTEHQKLDNSKLGQDLLPTYSGPTQKEGGHEVEVEVEVEVKGEGEGKSGATPPTPPAPVKVKYLDFVYLLPDEHEKLLIRYGPEGTEKWIERVNRYAHKIGEKKFKKKYSSHYHVILEWDEKDGGSNAGLQKPTGGRETAGDRRQQERDESRRIVREKLGLSGRGCGVSGEKIIDQPQAGREGTMDQRTLACVGQKAGDTG